MLSKTKYVIGQLIHVGLELTKYHEKGEAGYLLLLGFVLTALSPFWAALSIVELTINTICSIVVPVCGIILTLFVGLPLLNVIKWLYGTYWFLYTIIMYVVSLIVSLFTYRGKKNNELKRRVSIYQGKRHSTVRAKSFALELQKDCKALFSNSGSTSTYAKSWKY